MSDITMFTVRFLFNFLLFSTIRRNSSIDFCLFADPFYLLFSAVLRSFF